MSLRMKLDAESKPPAATSFRIFFKISTSIKNVYRFIAANLNNIHTSCIRLVKLFSYFFIPNLRQHSYFRQEIPTIFFYFRTSIYNLDHSLARHFICGAFYFTFLPQTNIRRFQCYFRCITATQIFPIFPVTTCSRLSMMQLYNIWDELLYIKGK